MLPVAGVNHFALSVTDLDRSQRFYTDVLGFLAVLDVGYGRVMMHKSNGFTIGLMKHPEGRSEPFTELNAGLDHIGLAAADRNELVMWQQHFEKLGVPHTPVQDMPLGHHLNFRDPDNIPLELQAPNAMYAAALADLQSREVSDAEILAVAEAMLGSDSVPRLLSRVDQANAADFAISKLCSWTPNDWSSGSSEAARSAAESFAFRAHNAVDRQRHAAANSGCSSSNCHSPSLQIIFTA